MQSSYTLWCCANNALFGSEPPQSFAPSERGSTASQNASQVAQVSKNILKFTNESCTERARWIASAIYLRGDVPTDSMTSLENYLQRRIKHESTDSGPLFPLSEYGRTCFVCRFLGSESCDTFSIHSSILHRALIPSPLILFKPHRPLHQADSSLS